MLLNVEKTNNFPVCITFMKTLMDIIVDIDNVTREFVRDNSHAISQFEATSLKSCSEVALLLTANEKIINGRTEEYRCIDYMIADRYHVINSA